MNNHKFITTIERNPGMNESSPLIFGSNDCCCSVSKSCPTLCDLMGCSTSGFLVLHHLLELAQTHPIESVMSSNHLILCHPLVLLPAIFPSIRVLSNESALQIRWLKSLHKKDWLFHQPMVPEIILPFRTDLDFCLHV